MTDDELRQRFAATDPASGVELDSITSPQARALLEDIMNTPVDTTSERRSRAPWWQLGGAAAAVIAIVAVGVAVLGGGDATDEVAAPVTTSAPSITAAPTTAGKLKVLELGTGVEDTMAMCMQITSEALADMQVAFKGTVTSAENGIVTLTIDQPYKGTDAQVATLVAPEGMEALIGGVVWEVGQPYLITAFDGTVNYCGFSGPATPELQALFDQAFPA